MNTPSPAITRRGFLKSSSAALAGGLAARPLFSIQTIAAPNDLLKIGLIGCGGRGTGAAAQALAGDKNSRLVALGDAFEDRLLSSLKTLKAEKEVADRIDVPPSRQFTGFEAYEKVIAESDVVLLATPPHFRPIHMKAAVAARKHIFAEKPIAVDAPGVRSVLASCEEAKQKGLAVVSGLALRYSYPHRETVKRIQAGALGKIRALQANDFRGPIWVKPRQPEWSDMTYHMRNWYYFTWLSGDFNVEQHVHMLDLCSWILKDTYPEKAYGTGGRQVRTAPEYGNIYDHHAVIYEYADGTKLFATCRQQAGCMNDIAAHVMGEKGVAAFSARGVQIDAEERWVYRGEKNNQSQTEHDEMFASIRSGKPLNNGDYMSKSTLLAIMGRMATYTGQTVTWDEAMNSTEALSPQRYSWDAAPPISEVAVPGKTKLV